MPHDFSDDNTPTEADLDAVMAEILSATEVGDRRSDQIAKVRKQPLQQQGGDGTSSSWLHNLDRNFPHSTNKTPVDAWSEACRLDRC
jgi:hypothetical protein